GNGGAGCVLNVPYTPNHNFFGEDAVSFNVADSAKVTSNSVIVPITVKPGPAPTLSNLSPSVGKTDGGTTVTITGLTFTTDATPIAVLHPTTPCTTAAVCGSGASTIAPSSFSSTSIVFTTPAHALGAVLVQIINSDTQTSNTLTFTYSPPAIGSINPGFGP